jgi:DNA-binding NarL/FixJ family response regulator
VDFTPLLPKIRKYQARVARLIGGRGLVVCLGNRLMLNLAVGTAREPARLLGAATTETEGIRLVEQHRPDLLVASDQLEQGCGFSLVVAAKRLRPAPLTLLVVGRHPSQRHLQAVMGACCEGILLESRVGLGHELTALRTVCSGGIYIDRQLGVAVHPAGAAAGRQLPRRPLTSREREVLQAVAEGRSNAEIGQRYYLSVDTVKTHLRHVLAKLEARDRTHAVALAIGLGLIDSPVPGVPG